MLLQNQERIYVAQRLQGNCLIGTVVVNVPAMPKKVEVKAVVAYNRVKVATLAEKFSSCSRIHRTTGEGHHVEAQSIEVTIRVALFPNLIANRMQHPESSSIPLSSLLWAKCSLFGLEKTRLGVPTQAGILRTYRLPSGPFSDDTIGMSDLRAALSTLLFKHSPPVLVSVLITFILAANVARPRDGADDPRGVRTAFSCDLHAILVSSCWSPPTASSPRPTPPPSPCSTWVSVSHALLADAGDVEACVELLRGIPLSERAVIPLKKRKGWRAIFSVLGRASLALKTGKNERPQRGASRGFAAHRLARKSTAPFARKPFRGPSLAAETHARDASMVG
ncbi:hypothetical protein B0H13DRAFT_2669587 [Mycena leptocephala]|nr:hypothetical protein B0H13DRAFT_2669587 [Mycena leptocephala]